MTDTDGSVPTPDPEPVEGPGAATYVVDVKRSARRASADAGAWVRDHGPLGGFDSKKAARSWARAVSDGRTVWVQDATPADTSGVDGYVVARRYDPERTRAREQAAATAQATLDAG